MNSNTLNIVRSAIVDTLEGRKSAGRVAPLVASAINETALAADMNVGDMLRALVDSPESIEVHSSMVELITCYRAVAGELFPEKKGKDYSNCFASFNMALRRYTEKQSNGELRLNYKPVKDTFSITEIEDKDEVLAELEKAFREFKKSPKADTESALQAAAHAYRKHIQSQQLDALVAEELAA